MVTKFGIHQLESSQTPKHYQQGLQNKLELRVMLKNVNTAVAHLNYPESTLIQYLHMAELEKKVSRGSTEDSTTLLKAE